MLSTGLIAPSLLNNLQIAPENRFKTVRLCSMSIGLIRSDVP